MAIAPKRRAAQTREVKTDFASHVTLAKAVDDLEWQKFLRAEITRLLNAFYALNAAVFLLVVCFWHGDTFSGSENRHPPVITEKVVLALIAASAAQLGGLAFAAAMAVIRRGGNRK